MYCVKCGKVIPEGSKFCTNCGAPVAEVKPQGNGLVKPVVDDQGHQGGNGQNGVVQPQPNFYSERGNGGQGQTPSPGGKGFPPAPVVPEKKKNKKLTVLLSVGIPLLVILLGAAGFFGYQFFQARQQESQRVQLVKEGDEAMASGDMHSAMKSYREALKLKPQDPEAALGLAQAHLYQEDFSKAERELEELALSQDDPQYAQREALLGVAKLSPEVKSVNADSFPLVTVTLACGGDRGLEEKEVAIQEDGKTRTISQFKVKNGEAAITYKAESTDVSEEVRKVEITLKVSDFTFQREASYTTPKILPATVHLVSTDVTEYPKVKAFFRVEDEATGETVEGLNLESVTIRERVEGGEYLSRQVHSVTPLEDNEGLNIGLIADKSDSISDTDMGKVKQVMTEFVNSLHFADGDKAEVLAFDSIVQQMCAFTSDSGLLVNGISNMSTDGSTAFYDAVYSGVNHAALQGGARCVMAFTDGMDNMSYHSAQELIDYANSAQVPVYVVGVGWGVEESTLRAIAEGTGGRYWFIDDLYSLEEILDQVYAEQKELYVVEYESDVSIDQYASRGLEVTVAGSGYRAAKEETFQPVHSVVPGTHTSRYELIKESLTWEEAAQKCQEKGGHLATITSQAEMDQLVQMAKDQGVRYVWLGGYTSYDSYGNVFGHWVTGEDFTYAAWSTGEPSRVDRDGTPEWYIMLWDMPSLGGWTWNDQRNDPVSEVAEMKKYMAYICEYEE